jgi:hypothetical protein
LARCFFDAGHSASCETAAQERKDGRFLRLEALHVAAQLSLGQRQRPPLKKGTPEGQ